MESPNKNFTGKDYLTDRDTVEAFAKTYHCELTIWEPGEHWFHTPEQLAVLRNWEETET